MYDKFLLQVQFCKDPGISLGMWCMPLTPTETNGTLRGWTNFRNRHFPNYNSNSCLRTRSNSMMYALYSCWKKKKHKIFIFLKRETTESPKVRTKGNQFMQELINAVLRRLLGKLAGGAASQTGVTTMCVRRARHDYTIIIYQARYRIFSSMTELHLPLNTWLGVKLDLKQREAGCLCCR